MAQAPKGKVAPASFPWRFFTASALENNTWASEKDKDDNDKDGEMKFQDGARPKYDVRNMLRRVMAADAEPERAGLEPVYVLVVGLTQAGKSTLLNFLRTGLPFGGKVQLDHAPNLAPTGSGIESCTSDVVEYHARYGGQRFVFVDTPGLLDTRGDALQKENVVHILEGLRKYPTFNGMLLVHRLDTVLTLETKAAVQYYMQMLKPLVSNTMVVLTRAPTDSRSCRKAKADGRDLLSDVEKQAAAVFEVAGVDRLPFFPLELRCDHEEYEENALIAVERRDNMLRLLADYEPVGVEHLQVHKTQAWKAEDERRAAMLADRNKTTLRTIVRLQPDVKKKADEMVSGQERKQVLTSKLGSIAAFLQEHDHQREVVTASSYHEESWKLLRWAEASFYLESVSQVDLALNAQLGLSVQPRPLVFARYEHSTSTSGSTLVDVRVTSTAVTGKIQSGWNRGIYSRIVTLAPSREAYGDQIQAIAVVRRIWDEELAGLQRLRSEILLPSESSVDAPGADHHIQALNREIERNENAIRALLVDPIPLDQLGQADKLFSEVTGQAVHS